MICLDLEPLFVKPKGVAKPSSRTLLTHPLSPQSHRAPLSMNVGDADAWVLTQTLPMRRPLSELPIKHRVRKGTSIQSFLTFEFD